MTGPSIGSPLVPEAGRTVDLPVLCLRAFFTLLLGASALGKLLDMSGFYAVVDTYQVWPAPLLPAASWAMTLTEGILAFWFARGWRLAQAALAAAALHTLFSVWLLATLTRGLHLPNCGCFGVFWPRPLTWATPLEDAALVGLALLLWWRVRHRPTR